MDLLSYTHNDVVLHRKIACSFSIAGVKSSLCDAWAAVLVSVTIFVAVIPLATEVFAAYAGER